MDNIKKMQKLIEEYSTITLDNDVKETYIGKFSKFLQNYYRAVEKVSSDDVLYSLFCDWFLEQGNGYINRVFKMLDIERIDNRFNSFIHVYSKYIEDAYENDNIEVLFEFLYRIPKKMQTDFERFGFLRDEEAIADNDYQDEISECDYKEQKFTFIFNITEPDMCQALCI